MVGRNEAKSVAAVAELNAAAQRRSRSSADDTDKTAVDAMAARVAGELGRIDILVNKPASTSANRRRARTRRMEQRDPDQPHQRLPGLAGGLSCDEAGRRRQGHQYRFDDVDLRRQLRVGLRGEQRRHRAVHALLRRVPGLRTTSRSTRCCRAGSTPISPGAPAREIDGLHDKVLARTPAARWGVIDDFAGIAVFLSSSASDFTTGTAIPDRRRFLGHGLRKSHRFASNSFSTSNNPREGGDFVQHLLF